MSNVKSKQFYHATGNENLPHTVCGQLVEAFSVLSYAHGFKTLSCAKILLLYCKYKKKGNLQSRSRYISQHFPTVYVAFCDLWTQRWAPSTLVIILMRWKMYIYSPLVWWVTKKKRFLSCSKSLTVSGHQGEKFLLSDWLTRGEQHRHLLVLDSITVITITIN